MITGVVVIMNQKYVLSFHCLSRSHISTCWLTVLYKTFGLLCSTVALSQLYHCVTFHSCDIGWHDVSCRINLVLKMCFEPKMWKERFPFIGH